MTRPQEDAQKGIRQVPIEKVAGAQRYQQNDFLAVEEPLECQVVCGDSDLRMTHSVAVTMRTPGHDFDLAAGFLYTEEVIRDSAWIERISWRTEDDALCNVVQVHLGFDVPFDPEQLSRHVFTSSSCGICGKQTIERIRARHLANPLTSRPRSEVLRSLPQKLIDAQENFSQTGGLHASALFDQGGDLLLLREDVGRHNALDKVVGHLLRHDRLPAKDSILLLSGRASFELIQKAIIAGIPTIAAIGAPSSLAVDLAREFGVNLIGFLKGERFNVYAGQVD